MDCCGQIETPELTANQSTSQLQCQRNRIARLMHSHPVQVIVIILVVLDCLLVIAELLIDLKAFSPNKENVKNETEFKIHEKRLEVAAHTLHGISLGILSIFIVEIGLKLFGMGLRFFHHKLEVFDAVIVVVSFTLDLVFLPNESLNSSLALLIILRLWRVGRIINGIILSIETRAVGKIADEREARKRAEEELTATRDYADALEAERDALRELCRSHAVPDHTVATAPKSIVRVRVGQAGALSIEVDQSALPSKGSKQPFEVENNNDDIMVA